MGCTNNHVGATRTNQVSPSSIKECQGTKNLQSPKKRARGVFPCSVFRAAVKMPLCRISYSREPGGCGEFARELFRGSTTLSFRGYRRNSKTQKLPRVWAKRETITHGPRKGETIMIDNCQPNGPFPPAISRRSGPPHTAKLPVRRMSWDEAPTSTP